MHSLIPMPASVSLSPAATFTFSESTQIIVDPGNAEVGRLGRLLAELIGNTTETTPEVVEPGQEGEGPYIGLTLLGGDAADSDEGYELVIEPGIILISASQPAGLFYGIQTIRQLLPPYVEYTAAFPHPLTMPVGRITDAPRFEWRGAMLDVARHFLPPASVKRFIDHMALYKLNRLHIHLSDDQGWRLEIPGRPRLTDIGAKSAVGGGPGGYWSTDEYADLVRYADERFITIVPEIDMPGHTNAALASYAELNCDGVAREPYTGINVGFSFLCVEKEETYAFVEDVVREISAMTTGPFFHLGGDEVHELTAEQYERFVQRAMNIIAAHGRHVVGWDEIAEADLDLPPGTVVQVWQPQTRGTGDAVASAVARGARLILSPAERIYLDMKYDSSTVLGGDWAGHNSVQDAYDWEPTELVRGVPEAAILGVEAPLWSESFGKIEDVEYLAFPRLAGVAEIGWSPAESRSWNSYRLRLGAHGPRWTAMGLNFYRAPEVPWRQLEE